MLFGKYTPANRSTATADRGARVTDALDERSFSIIDALLRIGCERGTTAAAVALAWLCARSGVTSPIIGTRRLEQLDQNLAALDVTLDATQMAELDRLSEPALNFPANFLKMAASFMQGGTTVNGEASQAMPLMPTSDAERY